MFKQYPILVPAVQRGEAEPEGYLCWWPAPQVEQRLDKVQLEALQPTRRMWAYPGLENTYLNKGCLATLSALHRFEGAPEKQRDLLRVGILHYWVRASRGGFNAVVAAKVWPRMPVLSKIYEQAVDRVGGQDCPWEYYHTEVVPQTRCAPGDLPLDPWADADVREVTLFEAALEAEIDRILAQWQLVVVTLGAEGETARVARAEAELAAEAARFADWQVRNAAERAEREAELARLKAKHPRYGEWDRVAADELMTLVWATPISRLAREFGVSDMAIRARCKREKLATPPQGYWLRARNKVSTATTSVGGLE